MVFAFILVNFSEFFHMSYVYDLLGGAEGRAWEWCDI